MRERDFLRVFEGERERYIYLYCFECMCVCGEERERKRFFESVCEGERMREKDIFESV